jgi:hypothetical protein
MERIVYRVTLDTHKTGIQRTLQGFETADNMSRRISIGLVAGSDTYEIPLDHVTAMVYVTTPDATEPSINECVIEDNTIIYDVLPIATEGITEMQVKLIETRLDGARSVLVSPKFALEVTSSGTDDEGAEQTTTFTALEKALAQAKAVYDARMVSFEITEDCYIRVHYADGTVYENDYFHDAIFTENAMRSESFAKGGTGYRAGEDTDNAMYYKNVSESLFESCREINTDCREILTEVSQKSVYTSFSVNFESGHLTYLSQNYVFTIDENGNLQFEGQGEWTPSDATKNALEKLVTELTDTITNLENRVKALEA